MKLPAFQFYPGDWRKDENLSRCSLPAKGALIEILCLAFQCEKKGKLMTDGKPWSMDDICMAIGGDFSVTRAAVEELLTKNVLKKDKKGCIFSSRMVKDEQLRKVRRDAGLKGGNPRLLNQKVNQSAKQNPTPSSSSSTSSSTSVLKTKKIKESGSGDKSPTPAQSFEERKLAFKATLKPYLQPYGADMLKEFYEYWTEPNKSGTKFRQEMEKAWDIGRRLKTWASKDKNFSTQNTVSGNESNYREKEGQEILAVIR
jgi:hypothetical protein